MAKRKLAYCISGHGYGHGVRASALTPYLIQNFDIHYISPLSLDFFAEEMGSSFNLFEATLDVGCVQKDTLDVDVEATLESLKKFNKNKSKYLETLKNYFQKESIHLVLSDIASLPLRAAKDLGIPGYLMSNFTWTDIYRPYIHMCPGFAPLVEEMELEYQMASTHLALSPGIDPPTGMNSVPCGYLSRLGKSCREELGKWFGVETQKKWCLIYIGKYGLEGMDWDKLAQFKEWQFLGLYKFDGAPANYKVIQKSPLFSYADLTASADVVLGKLGYGLLVEAMVHSTPILYFTRNGFAEYEVLEKEVKEKKIGLEIPLSDLKNLNWITYLEKSLEIKFSPLKPKAGSKIAKLLAETE